MDGSPSQASRVRPGGHQLRREVIVHHQRERILTAAVELIAERGYRPVTVADIVKRAAIARARFYENFSSKQDCFFVAYARATAEAMRRVGEAFEQPEPAFPDCVRAALAALLAYMAAEPALVRACVVEAPAAGAATEQGRGEVMSGFASLLRRSRQQAGLADLPDTVEDSVVGGLYWLLYHAVLSSQPPNIEDLLPELTEFVLTPYIGVDAARAVAQPNPAPL